MSDVAIAAQRAPEVKICGLQRAEDALLATALGSDYLGVVLSEGFGRSMPLDRAGGLFDGIASDEKRPQRVAVLVDETAEEAARRARAIDADVLQLHGEEPPEVVEELRGAGGWRIWKAVRAASADDVREAVERYGDRVDGFLVEGYRDGVVGGGGVGLRVAPEELRAALPPRARFILAGGLTASNVADEWARFRPDVVDVSSGVESAPGAKDPDLLRRFFNAVRGRPPDRTIR